MECDTLRGLLSNFRDSRDTCVHGDTEVCWPSPQLCTQTSFCTWESKLCMQNRCVPDEHATANASERVENSKRSDEVRVEPPLGVPGLIFVPLPRGSCGQARWVCLRTTNTWRSLTCWTRRSQSARLLSQNAVDQRACKQHLLLSDSRRLGVSWRTDFLLQGLLPQPHAAGGAGGPALGLRYEDACCLHEGSTLVT